MAQIRVPLGVNNSLKRLYSSGIKGVRNGTCHGFPPSVQKRTRRVFLQDHRQQRLGIPTGRDRTESGALRNIRRLCTNAVGPPPARRFNRAKRINRMLRGEDQGV